MTHPVLPSLTMRIDTSAAVEWLRRLRERVQVEGPSAVRPEDP